MTLRALLWDVDGTLAETERDGHRLAFNRAFKEAGLGLHWDSLRYGELLAISGGAERIAYALTGLEGQPPEPGRVGELQANKQKHYAALVAEGHLAPRPGVVRLMAEAHGAGLAQAIVTTSGRVAVEALLAQVLPEAAASLEFWVCGGDVRCKKPDPEAYLLALARLNLEPQHTLALEDSHAGLLAAEAAGVPCVVSLSHYSALEPLERFGAARAVLDHLGAGVTVLQGPACQGGRVTLSYLQSLH